MADAPFSADDRFGTAASGGGFGLPPSLRPDPSREAAPDLASLSDRRSGDRRTAARRTTDRSPDPRPAATGSWIRTVILAITALVFLAVSALAWMFFSDTDAPDINAREADRGRHPASIFLPISADSPRRLSLPEDRTSTTVSLPDEDDDLVITDAPDVDDTRTIAAPSMPDRPGADPGRTMEPDADRNTGPSDDGTLLSDRSSPPASASALSASVPEGTLRAPRMPRYIDLPEPPAADPLPEAPVADLVEKSDVGPLPVIAPNGRTPWQTYARPFSGNAKAPRIAIVVTGLGQKTADAQAAVRYLPADVTLGFVPYGKSVSQWMTRAREAGHETLLDLSVEPGHGGQIDAGPRAVLSSLTEEENRRRLRAQLAHGQGYVGVIAAEGGPVTDTAPVLRPILSELKDRGLVYIHGGAVGAVNANADTAPPVGQITHTLDARSFQQAIDRQLADLEESARRNGHAIGVLSASPLTLTRLSAWLADIEDRGLVLAPVSALVVTNP